MGTGIGLHNRWRGSLAHRVGQLLPGPPSDGLPPPLSSQVSSCPEASYPHTCVMPPPLLTSQVSSCPEASSAVSSAYTRRMVSSVHQSRRADDTGGRRSPSLLLPEWQRAGAGGRGSGSSSDVITPQGLGISPDEEQLLKKPRTTQVGGLAARTSCFPLHIPHWPLPHNTISGQRAVGSAHLLLPLA